MRKQPWQGTTQEPRVPTPARPPRRPGAGPGRDLPQPLGPKPSPNAAHSDGATPDAPQLPVGPEVGRGQRGDVHGVAQGLVAGGGDEVAQDLPVVLDAAPLGVAVPQEYQLLLLPGPQASDTLFVDLRAGRAGEQVACGLRPRGSPAAGSGALGPSARDAAPGPEALCGQQPGRRPGATPPGAASGEASLPAGGLQLRGRSRWPRNRL